jgi:aspartate/methionine/tyrosine aminotransferase
MCNRLAAGSSYGKYGEGYVRFSLTVEEKQLDEAIERMLNNLKDLSFK